MPAWVLPAVMGGLGVISGASNARQAQKTRRQDQKMNEIEARYSNWLNPQYRSVSPGASTLGSVLGGGVSGALMGSNLNKALDFGGGPDFATSMESPLGGRAMAQDLGDSFQPGLDQMKNQVGNSSMWAPAPPTTGANFNIPPMGGAAMQSPVAPQPGAFGRPQGSSMYGPRRMRPGFL